jgi:hypothetical protein
MFAPGAGQRAALAAIVVGFNGMTAVFFLTDLAWPWYALVGSVGTFAAGRLASLIWPREPEPARADLAAGDRSGPARSDRPT